MRDDVLRLLKMGADKREDSPSPSSLTEREVKALEVIKKSFQNLAESDQDRHSIRYLLNEMTSLTVGEAHDLSFKFDQLVRSGTTSLNLSNLTEGMASSTTDDHEGASDEGMYGVSDGPSVEKGHADAGTDQKGNHGDAPDGQKGYLDEDDDEEGPPPEVLKKIRARQNGNGNGDDVEEKGHYEDHYPGDGDEGGAEEVPSDDVEEQEVPKDAPTPSPESNLAASDATYKDGKKQNEAEQHKTVAKDPGEPKPGTHDNKPETDDVEDHPDYSSSAVKAEDPSNSELNKGPAAVSCCENFEQIESTVVSMLENSGIPLGSDKWVELYCKGFGYALRERAQIISSKLQEARITESSETKPVSTSDA